MRFQRVCYKIRPFEIYWILPLVNSLPEDKILDQSKLKAFAGDKVNAAKMMVSLFDRVENTGGTRWKCWL